MALEPGTQLGPYEIIAPLGAGGMGEVYRATDSKLKREVAMVRGDPAPHAPGQIVNCSPADSEIPRQQSEDGHGRTLLSGVRMTVRGAQRTIHSNHFPRTSCGRRLV